MKSRIKGRNYEFSLHDRDIPTKINKKKTDESLAKTEKLFRELYEEIEKIYEENIDLYNLLEDVFLYASRYEEFADEIRHLRDQFATHNDEILAPEYVMTLYDLGYKWIPTSREVSIWEMVLEDTDEKEVVEEIQYGPELEVRRIRTVLWEKTDYGKSSKKISYRKKPIGKKLHQIIENTKKDPECRRSY